VAILALQLRKVSVLLHNMLGHKEKDWEHCNEEPCLTTQSKLHHEGFRDDKNEQYNIK